MDRFANDTIALAALAGGSEAAFDALFASYYPKVLQFVGQFCRDRSEAENIVQELFMNLWIRRASLASVASIDDYLFISARNAAIHYVKRSLVTCSSDDAARNVVSDDVPGDMKLCYDELYSFVMREIESMPEQRRRIFVMSRVDGLPNDEIARRLGISKRTVETHISLAIAHLRKLLPAIVVLTLIN